MMNKRFISVLMTLFAAGSVANTWAHEGHAPPGPIHDLHHLLWLLMAVAASGVLVYLLRRRGGAEKDRSEK